MPSIKEMNDTTDNVTEVTQEQRKAALSTINIEFRNKVAIDVFTEVAAYQLLDAVLIIAQNNGVTTLIPMDTVSSVTIRQKI